MQAISESLNIRPFRNEDEAAVIALWERAFPNEPPWNEPADLIRRKLAVQKELFFVCVSEERIVGTVMAGFDGVRGWVHKVAAHPDCKRHGIATRLMRAAEQGLEALGCRKLNLQVRVDNTSAIEFYKSAGYVVEERVSLSKRLGPAEEGGR
ncbi:MAG: GNAT family acetyltransferase [Pseudomonadales bacterium]